MMKLLKITKRGSYIVISMVFVSLCVVGVVINQTYFSSRVVLKDELGIHRKLLHNGQGEHACDCFSPFITEFKISKITSTGASFSWKVDARSTYQVKWGTNSAKPNYFPKEVPKVFYTEYTVVLTGLQPKTVYHVGPSSICDYYGKVCENLTVPNLRKNCDISGKGDWTFTTLNETSVKSQDQGEETSYPDISAMLIPEVTAKEVTIRWKTKHPATSLVEYGLTSAYGSKSAENLFSERDHSIQLFGLQAGVTYHARAVSKNIETGKADYSSNFTFKTPITEDRIANLTTVFNEPNPCSDRTMFVYYLYQPARKVTIDIFTLSGKLVATLEAPESTLKTGHNKVLWDLRDNAQKPLRPGLYAYKMKFLTHFNQVEVKKSNLMIRK